MSISAQSTAFFASLKPVTLRPKCVALGILVAVAGLASPADAGPRPGAYDGEWNVVFTTRAGSCSSSNSAPFNVAGTRVSSAGGGKVTGGVTPAGLVSVHISVGLSQANGTGRLAGKTGTGRWSGIISGDRCSGTWQATRT